MLSFFPRFPRALRPLKPLSQLSQALTMGAIATLFGMANVVQAQTPTAGVPSSTLPLAPPSAASAGAAGTLGAQQAAQQAAQRAADKAAHDASIQATLNQQRDGVTRAMAATCDSLMQRAQQLINAGQSRLMTESWQIHDELQRAKTMALSADPRQREQALPTINDATIRTQTMNTNVHLSVEMVLHDAQANVNAARQSLAAQEAALNQNGGNQNVGTPLPATTASWAAYTAVKQRVNGLMPLVVQRTQPLLNGLKQQQGELQALTNDTTNLANAHR